MLGFLCLVACILLFVSEELLHSASHQEISMGRSWELLELREQTPLSSQLCTTQLHP